MKTVIFFFRMSMLVMIPAYLLAFTANAQRIDYPDSWDKQGFTLTDNTGGHVELTHSIQNFIIEDVLINGQTRKNISLPGTFLFNDAGAPNLPGSGRMIAIPNGSTPTLKIVAQRTEVIQNIEIAPAPIIPLENEPMLPSEENPEIYTKNALYPASPVIISEISEVRGIQTVIIGITPFQYNPVTKELIIYRDLKVEVSFEGGNGQFGEDRLRSRYWDPILADQLLNHESLPEIDYNQRLADFAMTEEEGAEYVIIIPTGPEYAQWADSLKRFRNEQGILTKVVSLSEIGANTTNAIESFINNAYSTWTIPPAACLLMADYGADGTKNIISYLRTDHPGGYNPYITDNPFADYTGNQLPDICFARMTANNATQLQTLVTKTLNYERNAPTNPGFYEHPIFALGWQTERWFQICQESVVGYLRNVHGMDPVRINEIYSGSPNGPWSTATNTTTVVNYFGANGLGYFPASPSSVPGSWTGGNASAVNAAINDGGFLIQHRDHGNYTCWGEPDYCNNNVNSLTNTELPFLMSINCQTGAFNRPGDCLVERFHRFTKNGQNAGAVAAIGDTEVSYSFVNDTYTWGVYDNFWTDFMPDYGTTPESRGFLPCFGNAAGKYFLQQSNWPYNASSKPITYRLFHFHGDAFQTIFYQLPESLTINHDSVIWENETSFDVSADVGSLICLSKDGEILGTETGTGSPVTFTIPPMVFGQVLIVTVTKEHHHRYRSVVPVTTDQLYAVFMANKTAICAGNEVHFTDLSTGTPSAWEWTFDGGTPATSTERNPVVAYDTPGTYTVSLIVTKDGSTNTETKNDYINVYSTPVADYTVTSPCINKYCQFTDGSDPNGGEITGWLWNFGHPASGIYDTSHQQNPVHAYNLIDTYDITLIVTNNGTCNDTLFMPLDIVDKPEKASQPAGETNLCQASAGNEFIATSVYAAEYLWEIDPADAGTFSSTAGTTTLDLSSTFLGPAHIKARGINDCGNGAWSDEHTINVVAVLTAPSKPQGPDTVDVNKVLSSDFTTTEVSGASSYNWFISPDEAGTATGNGLTGTVMWDPDYRGYADITAKAYDGTCDGLDSEVKSVFVRSTVGMDELTGMQILVYPNPSNGKFTLDISAERLSTFNLKVFTMLGNLVFIENGLSVSSKLTKTVDLSSLPAGVYHLKVEGSNGTVIRKIVLER